MGWPEQNPVLIVDRAVKTNLRVLGFIRANVPSWTEGHSWSPEIPHPDTTVSDESLDVIRLCWVG